MKFRIKCEADRDAVKAYIDRIPLGRTEYDAEVKRRRPKMSDPQRDLYWMWIGVIAEETGNDRDMLHKVLKGKFLGYTEEEVLGVMRKKVKSIKPLSKKEMSDYMTQVDAYMLTEFDIVLPHPDDLYYDSLKEEGDQ